MWKRPFRSPTRSLIIFTLLLIMSTIFWQLSTLIATASPNINPDQLAPNPKSINDSDSSPISFVSTGQSIGSSVSRDVALGDVDGDGDLDAFVANRGENKIWLNDGKGLFSDSQQSLGDNDSYSVALGDLDGDGDLDAFVANHGRNILWLNQQGQFIVAAQSFSNTTSYEAALGDLNGDGFLDIVVANDGKNEVWLNNLATILEDMPAAEIALQSRSDFFLEMAQEDGEWSESISTSIILTKVDANSSVDAIFFPDGIWLNDGESGMFTLKTAFPSSLKDELNDKFNEELNPLPKITVGNFDNDLQNQPDLLVGFSRIQLFSNFQAQDILLESTDPSDGDGFNEYSQISLGDLNLDGVLDVIVAQPTPNKSYVAELNNGELVNRQSFAANYSQAAALGDLNGDGLLDTFMANGAVTNFTAEIDVAQANLVLLNTSSPLRQADRLPWEQGTFRRIHKIEITDLNNDGVKEIITSRTSDLSRDFGGTFISGVTPNSSGLRLAQPSGPASFFDEFNSFPYRIRGLAIDNLNEDTLLDVVTFNRNGGISIIRSSGDDSDETWETITYSETLTTTEGSVTIANINNDELNDIVVSNSCSVPDCSQNNLIYRNDGNGSFTQRGTIGAGASHDIALGDLDGDNDLDAFVANYWNQPNKVFLNDGNGVFTDSGLIFGGFSSMDAAMADLDGDGDLDMLETRYNMGVTVWWNEGQLRFTEETLWWGPSDFIYVKTADFNEDGQADILISTTNTVALLTNRGSRRFATQTLAADRLTYPANAISDVDNDGDLDILLTFRDGSIEQYTNDRQGFNTAFDDTSYIITIAPFKPAEVSPETLIKSSIVPVTYGLATANGLPAPQIRAFYSLNGGGDWREALPEDASELLNVPAGPNNQFHWDTFKSGFFGESNNVILRFVAQTHSGMSVEIGTYRYEDQIGGSFQRASSSTTTPPFRVQGTQIQVNSQQAAAPPVPAEGASVYLLREGMSAAQLMGTQQGAFTTNISGTLSGRGSMQLGAQLLAMQPISQAFRIPPQLIFGGDGLVELETTDLGIDNAVTAEFWLLPRSESATLLTMGNQITLSYAIPTDQPSQTDIVLSLAEQTYTYTFPLHNGIAHHLALSWNKGTQNANFYLDGEKFEPSASATMASIPIQSATFNPLRLGQDYAGSLDDIRLWNVFRSGNQIANGRFEELVNTLDEIETIPGLIGYWPIGEADQENVADESGNNRPLMLQGETAVGYKPLYTFYHTSGIIEPAMTYTQTINGQQVVIEPQKPFSETVNGVQFTEVASPGLQQLTVSPDNPLILFDLDVSLEWDARNDVSFLRDLEDSFRDASALLYDVTNGQVALGQINLFHDKAYWGTADIVIFADNSLRPSAAIGGVVNERTDEPALEEEEAAYLPGQIRMGTSWDPYGENTADLGLEWSRALAHELAHYLLFLPDNYLGIDEAGIFRRVVCPGSFMTTTSDPTFSEFLTADEWTQGDCSITLAEQTTGRDDWETITEFYKQLKPPPFENTINEMGEIITSSLSIDGPTDLPLAVTYMLPWSLANETIPFPARNFDVRDDDQARLRLPNAQAYIIKTAGTLQPEEGEPADSLDYLTDDRLIFLGSPVGGGDRLDVRGAEEADQLCLFDSSRFDENNQGYAGCIENIDSNTVAINVAPVWTELNWQPQLTSYALDATTVVLTITQELFSGDRLRVQLFPLHYGSVPGNAPVTEIPYDPGQPRTNPVNVVTFTMPLPAFETAVYLSVIRDEPEGCGAPVGLTCQREALFTIRLNPNEWGFDTNLPTVGQSAPLIFAPISLNPDSTIVGGPDSTIVGGGSLFGNPDSTIVGGPDSTIVGGAGRILLGHPDSTIVGGALLLGNPDSTIVGGPDSTIVGGAGVSLLGNPDSTIVGGTKLLGNPDSTIVGGGNQGASAPLLSADASVVIYSKNGLFADNGVNSIQSLAAVPEIDTHPWLLPVGKAYQVDLATNNDFRFISFSYQQRDVPEGFEFALALYFLPDKPTPDGTRNWLRLDESVGFVENLVVGTLQSQDGIYALMATIPLAPLSGGEWSLLPYPMPDCRSYEDALASIGDRLNGLIPANNSVGSFASVLNPIRDNDEYFTVPTLEPGQMYWVHLESGPSLTPFLRPPQRLPTGEFASCEALLGTTTP